MNPPDRIVLEPGTLDGKPIVRGRRLLVEYVLGLLAQGWSETDVARNYASLTREDLIACLRYAAETFPPGRTEPEP